MHAHSCPTLCNPTDCSPAGSTVHGIVLARILEWAAISSSRGSSPPRDQTCISFFSCVAGRFFTSQSLGKPRFSVVIYFIHTPLQYPCLENPMDGGACWAAVHGVAKSRTRLSDFTFPFDLHALEKEIATHSSVVAWRNPGTGEPGGLPSMGSHRVGHD